VYLAGQNQEQYQDLEAELEAVVEVEEVRRLDLPQAEVEEVLPHHQQVEEAVEVEEVLHHLLQVEEEVVEELNHLQVEVEEVLRLLQVQRMHY